MSIYVAFVVTVMTYFMIGFISVIFFRNAFFSFEVSLPFAAWGWADCGATVSRVCQINQIDTRN